MKCVRCQTNVIIRGGSTELNSRFANLRIRAVSLFQVSKFDNRKCLLLKIPVQSGINFYRNYKLFSDPFINLWSVQLYILHPFRHKWRNHTVVIQLVEMATKLHFFRVFCEITNSERKRKLIHRLKNRSMLT